MFMYSSLYLVSSTTSTYTYMLIFMQNPYIELNLFPNDHFAYRRVTWCHDCHAYWYPCVILW